jgi:hypothetical protein
MNLFPFLFGELLRKASAAISPQKKPAVSPPTDRDHEIHNSKIHYGQNHEANQVVQRTITQNPHMNRNLRAYKCPVCHHSRDAYMAKEKKPWIVGHKPILS